MPVAPEGRAELIQASTPRAHRTDPSALSRIRRFTRLQFVLSKFRRRTEKPAGRLRCPQRAIAAGAIRTASRGMRGAAESRSEYLRDEAVVRASCVSRKRPGPDPGRARDRRGARDRLWEHAVGYDFIVHARRRRTLSQNWVRGNCPLPGEPDRRRALYGVVAVGARGKTHDSYQGIALAMPPVSCYQVAFRR